MKPRKVICGKGKWIDGKWTIIFERAGFFHQFAQETNEDGQDYPVAIVEHLDGTVDTYTLSCIQFIEPSRDVAQSQDNV